MMPKILHLYHLMIEEKLSGLKEDFDKAVIAEQESIKTKSRTNITSKKKLTSILEENVENLKETQETVFGFAGD